MNNETYNLGGMHHQLEGAFKVAVVDAKTDEIVWSQTDWHKNLILNAGMNKIVSTTYAGMFGAGIVGTGTRTNSAPGNNAVVSQTGTTLTLTTDPTFLAFTQSLGGYSQALEVGDVIVFATGWENYQRFGHGRNWRNVLYRKQERVPNE